MFLSDLSIKRPILVSMILVVFLLFGGIAFFGMNLDLTPNVDFPIITVQTLYPGAGPTEIENQITRRIEDAVSSISKIDEMTSYSMESVSYVMLQFDLDKNVDIANQEVKDKVDAMLNLLPEDAERPIIQKFNINAFPIIDIILSGDLEMTELYDIADKQLRDRFAQLEGVANVSITGGEQREIKVQLDNRIVFQNSLSLAQLAGLLQAQNLDMPGGHFRQHTQEYSVRLDGKFKSLEALRQLEIPTAFGNKKLGDLAEVIDSGAEVRERTSYFNNISKLGRDNVILLSLIKSAEGNTVQIADAVHEALPEIERELPPGSSLDIVTDRSTFIRATVEDTLTNIILGIVFTALVLFFFLHDVRSTLIVGLSMPMSILSTFLFMDLFGFTLNIMTLMGLSTAVGILVTNSVVVLENIFRHKNMGSTNREAASVGTAEIVVAVIASTMTNIAVFLPIAFMSSMVGLFMKEFALTVVFATLFSLIMSFTLTPMMSSLILPEKNRKIHRIGDVLESIFRSWELRYQKILGFFLKNKRRAAALILVSIVLFLASFGIATQIGFEFMPMLDEGDITIEVELPQGANLDQTAELLSAVQERLTLFEELQHVVITIGSISAMDQGTNLALVDVKLVDAANRDPSTIEMTSKFIEALSDIPNANIRVSAVSMIGGGDDPIAFNLLGQEVDTLEVYKNIVLDRIEDIEGLVNLNTSSRAGKPEVTLHPDRATLASAGLTVFDLALTLRNSMTGMISTQYRDNGEEYDVRVLINESSYDSPEEIGALTVVAPTGTYRLAQLTEIEFSEGYSTLLHKDKYKTIEFNAGVAPGYVLGDITGEIDRRTEDIVLPSGYSLRWGGDTEMMQETITDMIRTFLIALVLTYMLLAAILESLTQPLMILGTVPLAFIGVFVGLFVTGLAMNAISMMAIVMLLGIVVNNAILLLDYTNLLVRKEKKDIRSALIEACPTKLKPILMASLAIMLGMLPMAMGLGAAGREMRQPMGVVAIGGLAVSTVLALLIIPVLYYLFSKVKRTERTV